MPEDVKYEDEKLRFNLCEQYLPAFDDCEGDYYAFIRRKDKPCVGLKASNEKADTFALDMRNDDGEISGVSLNYYGDDACQIDSSRGYHLQVNITCDDSVDFLTYVSTEGDKCSPTVNYKSKKACPVFTFNQLT